MPYLASRQEGGRKRTLLGGINSHHINAAYFFRKAPALQYGGAATSELVLNAPRHTRCYTQVPHAPGFHMHREQGAHVTHATVRASAGSIAAAGCSASPALQCANRQRDLTETDRQRHARQHVVTQAMRRSHPPTHPPTLFTHAPSARHTCTASAGSHSLNSAVGCNASRSPVCEASGVPRARHA